MFQSWAHRLARDYDRVLYYRPDPPKPVHSDDDAVCKGYEDVERIYDLWGNLDEIDTFAFFHVQWGSWAEYLRSIGKRVWSSFYGENIELDRVLAKQVMEKVDLPVVPYELVTGIDGLKQYLEDHGEQIVKVSRVRGLCETFPARNPIVVEMKLDKLQSELGPLKTTQEFMVEESVDAESEDGYDGWCVYGQFPKKAFWGVEIKNQSYVGQWEWASLMPRNVRTTNEKIAPILADYGYCSFWHTEIRNTKKGFYPIDFTCRCASPAGEGMQEMVLNWGEIIEGGIDGQIIEPEVEHKYFVQAVIVGHRADQKWIPFEIPPQTERWIKLYASMKKDDVVYSIPMHDSEDELGYVVGVGNTVDAAIKNLEEHVDAVKNSEIKIKIDSIDEARSQIKKAA